MSSKPRILVARAIFPDVLDYLSQHFEVESNQSDTAWSPEQLIEKLQGKVGILSTGGERISAALLAACPQLRICANMAVGFNNFDVDAMTVAGVQGTNAPDVLTETTADFGFALLMATARRVTESEHYLRAGHWKRWSYDMFCGSDIHGSTLGIIGMGRIGQAIARRGALGFGMQVMYHNRSRLDAATEAACGARYVDKTTLLQTADHVLLVVPYSAASHHTIGAAELAQMKPTATLINYSWFDTAVNAYLIEQGVLDIQGGSTIGLVVETQCNYFASLAFPQAVQAGIRVAKLGTSSVRYEVGIFGEGEFTAAKGHFIHVYVDQTTRKPVALPSDLKKVLETLL